MDASRRSEHALEARTLGGELGLTARLGVPLALGELGWMSTYIVDALMIGRLPHSALSISASSLGNTIFYVLVFMAVNMLTGLQTLVAQAWGRGDKKDCLRSLMQSLWIVAVGTPLVMAGTMGALRLLPHFGTPADIIAETSRYLHALVWSAPPLLLYMALRRYLQSIDRVVLVMVSLITASLVNWGGDWALLYGHLGFHAMGIAGSGWSTVVVRLYMAVLVVVAVLISLRHEGEHLSLSLLKPNLPRLRMFFQLGWAPALGSITDYGVSTYMSILCARLGTTLLAAHQVVLDLDAFVFTVPLGLAYATATRVGQSAGRSNLPQIRRSATASLLMSGAYIVIAASLFASFPHLWGNLYTNDKTVVAAAAPIFLICGFLQLADAMGIIFNFCFTGIGDTRTPFLVNVFWYWFVGMPLAYCFTFGQGLALRGLWTGRAVASIGSTVTIAVFWWARLRRLEAPNRSQQISLFSPAHAK